MLIWSLLVLRVDQDSGTSSARRLPSASTRGSSPYAFALMTSFAGILIGIFFLFVPATRCSSSTSGCFGRPLSRGEVARRPRSTFACASKKEVGVVAENRRAPPPGALGMHAHQREPDRLYFEASRSAAIVLFQPLADSHPRLCIRRAQRQRGCRTSKSRTSPARVATYSGSATPRSRSLRRRREGGESWLRDVRSPHATFYDLAP